MTDALDPIRFDTKTAVLLREDLPPWQELNVTAFLMTGIAGAHPELIGEPYLDADGQEYLRMMIQPVLVLVGDAELLRLAHGRAIGRQLSTSIFTAQLFATGNDRDNRAAVAAVPTASLDLVGIGVHGPKNAVDKAMKGARMHA
ncbi:DUF2000 domain-containing protein [Naasia lichenicola]|uniref:DUF2000 domain-containing protein n=1 Tax=Naasia lichenicola TaxID=2565933 RepID=A0A4S4FLD4_9MICO|nr:DUF2000 domain-containing protein [Naasia lichenicola]THG30125.1 DUF2000 domain-containing protein [Naasia lichenicola]